MPDARAVPEDEARERIRPEWLASPVMSNPELHPRLLRGFGLRWDGTQYLDTEGSQE